MPRIKKYNDANIEKITKNSIKEKKEKAGKTLDTKTNEKNLKNSNRLVKNEINDKSKASKTKHQSSYNNIEPDVKTSKMNLKKKEPKNITIQAKSELTKKAIANPKNVVTTETKIKQEKKAVKNNEIPEPKPKKMKKERKAIEQEIPKSLARQTKLTPKEETTTKTKRTLKSKIENPTKDKSIEETPQKVQIETKETKRKKTSKIEIPKEIVVEEKEKPTKKSKIEKENKEETQKRKSKKVKAIIEETKETGVQPTSVQEKIDVTSKIEEKEIKREVKKERKKKEKREVEPEKAVETEIIEEKPVQKVITHKMKKIKKSKEEGEPEKPKAPPSNVRYSDEDLEIFRQRILELRKEAIDELRMLKDRLDDLNSYDFAEESMIYSMHMAEQGSEAMEKEKTYAQIQRINEYIKKLDEALQRIKDKTYGICRVCGCLIAKERLMAVPITTLSASYKIHKKCPEDGIDKIEPLAT